MKGTALLMAFGRPAEMTPQQKLGYGYLTGMMPLHMAATEEIAKLLISKGANEVPFLLGFPQAHHVAGGVKHLVQEGVLH